jgi:hypothetical protein
MRDRLCREHRSAPATAPVATPNSVQSQRVKYSNGLCSGGRRCSVAHEDRIEEDALISLKVDHSLDELRTPDTAHGLPGEASYSPPSQDARHFYPRPTPAHKSELRVWNRPGPSRIRPFTEHRCGSAARLGCISRQLVVLPEPSWEATKWEWEPLREMWLPQHTGRGCTV